MADTGTPPVIPAELQQYDSYIEDPKWQIKFTIAWTSALALFALLTLPSIFRSRKKWATQIFGVREDWQGRYARLNNKEPEDLHSSETTRSIPELHPVQRRHKGQITVSRLVSALGTIVYWTLPGIGLNMGQFFLIVGYAGTVLACVCTSAPLLSNSNRAGFLAIAQLPPVFLLASKNTLLSLVLPSFFSYTRLNTLHRWAGRTLFLAAVIHGSMWISNHLTWGIPIIGEQKETSGVAALGVLCVIVLSSLRPVRVWAWGIFYWIHFLAVPAFFITVCYHTTFAAPWIIPPIAFYAFDLLMRAGRFRLKDAQLIRVDNQMTLIHIPDCDAGFRAGQHLRVRIFFAGRVFEAHPLSIMCAPSSISGAGEATCLQTKDAMAYYDDDADAHGTGGTALGILLGARVMGDWTRALNDYAQARENEILAINDNEDDRQGPEYQASTTKTLSPAPKRAPVPVQVLFDGPYGGCSLDLPDYERVLLVAGGSGATFVVGLLDDLIAGSLASIKAGKKVKTQRIHFVWCTRSFGSLKWFAPLLRSIALAASSPSSPISLNMTVYVTCMCVPEVVNIPGLEVRTGSRPEMARLVGGFAGLFDDGMTISKSLSRESEEELCDETPEMQPQEKAQAEMGDIEDVEKQVDVRRERFQGGLAVCASGPESLTREAANAVARYAGRGSVALHTEVFAI